jgi:hypothetical protein
MEVTMDRELTLRISDSLFEKLKREAKELDVSLDYHCFSLLSGDHRNTLLDPSHYQSLNLDVLRKEIRKVIESDLSKEEVRKRVNALEFQISRRYIR